MDINTLQPVPTLKELRRLCRKLAFEEDEFDQANREQAKLYLIAARFRVEAMRRKHLFQRKLEALRAKKGLEARREKHRSKGRMNETEVKDRVMLDPEVRLARRRFESSLELEEFATYIMRAYDQRRSVIKVITDTRNAEIANEIRNVREEMARNTMQKMSRKARQRLAERGDDWDDTAGKRMLH